MALDEVIGQDQVVLSLAKLLSGQRVPHAFLLTGPSGTGKTTIARIIAKEIGIPSQNVLELDAATNSGVDDMRAVTGMARYAALGEDRRRAIIIDEAHALSKATFQSLLKSIEEPPEHVYWILCTTEHDKIPKTIVTRCTSYELRPVPKNTLDEFLEHVAEAEGIEIGSDALGYVVEKADGSVRQALVDLAAAEGCQTRAEAMELLSRSVDTPELIDLARLMLDAKLTWRQAIEILREQIEKGQSAEGVRLVIVSYLGNVLMGTKDEKRVVRVLGILSSFREPYRTNEKMAPLLLSLGEVLYGQR